MRISDWSSDVCSSDLHDQSTTAKPSAALDPVCGMTVDPATAKYRQDYRGTTYYFCSARCLEKFRAAPEDYLKPREARERSAGPAAESALHTRTMHHEGEQEMLAGRSGERRVGHRG